MIAHAGADPPVAPDTLSEALARAARDAGVTPVPDAFARAARRLAQGAVPAERLAGFARIAPLARMGWQAYLAVEPALAADRLAEARRAAEAVLDLPGGPVIYADVCLRLGVVLRQLGRAGEGDALMRLAATLDPAREVSIAAFAPDVVAAYQAARGATLAAARVRVVVRLVAAPARAPGSEVIIDGRSAGPSPIDVDLPTGLHVIVARAPGHRSRALVVAVAPGQAPVEITLAPDPAAAAVLRGPAALAVGHAGDSARAAAAGLLAYGELDAVVLAASVWRRGAPALLGQRCELRAGNALACTAVVEIGHARAADVSVAARELWSTLAAQRDSAGAPAPTLLADARLVQAEPRPAPPPAPRPRRAWYRSPWIWVGVGAIVTATASTVWALSRDPEVTPVVTVDPCDFGACAP